MYKRQVYNELEIGPKISFSEKTEDFIFEVKIENRLLLAEKSQYEFLLFIDVDTTPSNENFLKNYLAQLHKGRIIFGGCNYKNPENKNSSLRYKFGKEREEINFAVRNKNPYKYISSNNFICERDLLFDILTRIDNISYGNDYIFGSILKKIKIDILHIDNPVLVNNIDENSIFIKKTHQALENLIICYSCLLYTSPSPRD